MPHEHSVIDSDIRFTIDPYSRGMKDSNPSAKTIMQYDHKSEVYTFGIPKIIEGHDMTLCDKVEVWFNNGGNIGIVPITDLHVSSEDEETLVFSWTVERASTQKPSALNFQIYFACVDENDEPTYEWHSLPFSRISVKAGISDKEAIDFIKEQIESYIELYGYELPTETYILVDEDGNEVPAVMVEDKTVFTATDNDIRIGMTAATETGVTVGTKEIPSYHVTEGYSLVPNGSDFIISPPPNNYGLYDFTKLQALICPFNKTLANSVLVEKVVINNDLYNVMSTETVANVIKDDENERINLGITNTSGQLYVIRYFTYKEVI